MRKAPLGVFDSGVGGLTVLNALRRHLPQEDFIYLGDTARVPYGGKPPEMVREFALEIALELVRRGVKGIVIACNTASAVSLPELVHRTPVPVWGVIEPGVQGALRVLGEARRCGRVGVLGTKGTVAAGVYQRALEASGVSVWARACPLFVPIVEEGISDHAIARLVVRHYLEDRPALDAVILGCTHYPALKPILQEELGPEVRLLDSAEETAKLVLQSLRECELLRPDERAGNVLHLVSGDAASYQHTARVLQGPAGPIERIHWGNAQHEVVPC